MRFTIGEFSRITELSVKSLRIYHDRGILVPAAVDPETGYRYYDERNVQTARSVKALKSFDFSLAEIKGLIDACSDDADTLPQLEEKLRHVETRIDRYRDIARLLRSVLASESEEAMSRDREFEIEETEVPTLLVAGHRMTGRYGEVGKGLGLVCKKMGRHICGKPMALYYDGEYKEDGADFEPCVPVRSGKDAEGITVHELEGGRCVTLIHRGSYENLPASYKRVFAYINRRGYRSLLPTREIYRKGPGLIFKGNPKNYLTEIQVLVEKAGAQGAPA